MARGRCGSHSWLCGAPPLSFFVKQCRMRTLAIIFLLLALALQGCEAPVPGGAPDPLAFYIVSDDELVDGRFVDTHDFPKLGYVRPLPDLKLNRLKSVAAVPFQYGGRQVGVPPLDELPTVVVFFRDQDMPALTDFAHRAARKKVLLMVGDKPIGVVVFSPLLKPSDQLTFTLGARGDRARINDEYALLKKLAQ